MMQTPLMITPAQGCVPPGRVVVVVVLVLEVVVLDVVVLDVVVELLVVDVAGRVVVVVVVAGRVVVVAREVVVVALVDDVVVEPGSVPAPPTVEGTHSVRSGVNRRDRLARLTSKHTKTWPAVTAAGATVGVEVGVSTHSRLGSRIRSCRRSPTFTGNGGVNRASESDG